MSKKIEESLLYGISTVTLVPNKKLFYYARKNDAIDYNTATLSQSLYTFLLIISIGVAAFSISINNTILAYLTVIIIIIMSLLPLTSTIILNKKWNIKEQ